MIPLANLNTPTPLFALFNGRFVDITITLLIVFSLVLFWLWVAWILYQNPPAGRLVYSCEPGQCGTSTLTGEKRCPDGPTQTIYIDPSIEVCNSRYTCEHPSTPYALRNDGSTNVRGVCDSGTTCRCLTAGSCPSYTTAYFEVVNGSLYDNQPGSRYVINQVGTSVEAAANVPHQRLTDTTTQLCGLKGYQLNRLSPSNCSFTFDQLAAAPVETLRACFVSNPCIDGVLAFTPDDPGSFESTPITSESIYTVPIGCVYQPDNLNPCGAFGFAFWDSRYSKLRCLT